MIPETIANFDIFLISESKIDSTFVNIQFKIIKYELFRRDRNKFGAGLMFYLNKEMLCKYLNNHPKVPNAEITCIEFHQLKRKWLLLGCFKPPMQSDLEFITSITKIVDFYSWKFVYCRRLKHND